MMKNPTRILTAVCAVLLVICVVLSVIVISGFSASSDNADTSGDASVLPATDTNSSIQFKLSLLHLYYESKDIVSTLPFTTIQVTQGALIKALMNSTTSITDALTYIDHYADRTLNSAYSTMDEILSKYQKLLTKYNISSTSSYRTKYNNLSSMFSSLKNSSNELLARTKSLIKMVNANDYDTYYTKYMEQISDLTSKIETYCKTIMDEYDTLLNSISDDYDILY